HSQRPSPAQDSAVVQADTESMAPDPGLVPRGLPQRGRVRHRLADGRVDPASLVAGQEALALLEDVVQRSLASDAAEDEIDRWKPPPRRELVDQHRRVDHAAREPAAPLVGAARLVTHHANAPRANALVFMNVA